MRNLPAGMEQRILDAIQTIDNSADPKMKAFIQRVYRYIQPGAMLTPITIRTGDALGPLDVAVKREDPDGPAHELMMVYIEGGIAKLANSTSYVIQPTGEHWSYIGDIAQAVDVAIDYDGYWLRTAFDPMEYGTYGRFNLITAGEPWIFRVSPEGALIARQGILGSDLTLVESGVTKVDALRGWKSILKAEDDQGLIVAYIKDGDVYYRTYAEQAGGTFIWESERQITEFDTSTYDAVNIAMFRTIDYRSGILAEINGIIYMLITHRNWSGMALPDEIITVSITDLAIDLVEVEHVTSEHEEIITARIDDLVTLLLWAGDTYGISAINIPTTTEVTAEPVGTGDGIEDEFLLLHEPGTGSETIYLDGVPVSPDDYTISGKTFTFGTPPVDTAVITADYEWENWGIYVEVSCDHGVTNVSGNHAQFAMDDDNEISYTPISTAEGDPVPKIGHFSGPRSIIVEFSDFNNAYPPGGPVGDLTISYAEGEGYIQGEAGQDLKTFSLAFTPLNLDPVLSEPPVVEAMWNE